MTSSGAATEECVLFVAILLFLLNTYILQSVFRRDILAARVLCKNLNRLSQILLYSFNRVFFHLCSIILLFKALIGLGSS